MSRRRPHALAHAPLAVALAALALLAACRKKEPVPAEELYTTRMIGLGYLQRNQLAEAESTFAKLTDLAPDDPLGFADLGITYLQAGRYEEAEKALKRARKLDDASVETGLVLARLYSLTNRADKARETLEALRKSAPRNARVLYALAALEEKDSDAAAAGRHIARLREALAIAPANLVLRLELAGALVFQGMSDSAAVQLEEVRRTPPAPPAEPRAALDTAIAQLRANDLARGKATLARLVGLMQVTPHYQAAREEVAWTDGPIPGALLLAFAPKDFVTLRNARGAAKGDLVKFTDVSAETGLQGGLLAGGAAPALALGDVDGDGTDDVLLGARLYRMRGGFVRDVSSASGIALPQGASVATFADADDDGWLDLLAIDGAGKAHLFHNKGDGTFAETTAQAGAIDASGATRATFADLDHDGDLDLLLTGSAARTYRNDNAGRFADATAAYGLAGGAASDAAFGDLDDDGRLDVVTTGDAGTTAYRNGGASRFQAAAAAGLAGARARRVILTDVDNDGDLDLLLAGPTGVAVQRNAGDATFAPGASFTAPADLALATIDFDNDGWLDVVTASAKGVALWRNDAKGGFQDRSAILPPTVRALGAASLAASDVDGDGDEDLLLVDAAGKAHLLRNDLGNTNLAANVSLKALGAGQGKNNAYGIGARVELRAGDLYQTRVVTQRVTHFGLGPHLKADVLRVEWPNGVPQYVYLPGSDQDVVERELLKGSCMFAYVWNGERYVFVTDVMWRSALGMPLGLMGSSSAFAPPGASQEYIRIPGELVKPKDGKYVFQFTEELWETAYADEIRLVAVDHPDSIDVFVDERFVPPGPVSLRPYKVGKRALPRSAVDERGRDVLPALKAKDDVYVSDLAPTRYQGVVEPHAITLDLGPDAGGPGSTLFLRGWIYPTDASINVALAQQKDLAPAPPSLEVIGRDGRWTTVVPSLGFPSGKDKTMAIDLAGRFPTADHRVRIATSMAIYWDEAFVATDQPSAEMRLTTLAPTSAGLHFRGYSRTYRKGGRHGPFWFDYDSVTKDSPWRPIKGAVTRFGDVRALLDRADDMYVIMAPGDEATVEFDASSAAALPPGWRRDFLLYTDGWIKDSDLNTAAGTTVEPLPFHNIRKYPYAKGEAFPADPAHERWRREYNTRVVGRR